VECSSGRGNASLEHAQPKLAYQTERAKPVKVLQEVLTQAIDKVNEVSDKTERDRRFRVFMDLFEAILAYHRLAAGAINGG